MTLKIKLAKERRKKRIVNEYLKLIEDKGKSTKQAARIICVKYFICRKTLYNYLNCLNI